MTTWITCIIMIAMLPSIALSDSSTKWPDIYPIAPGQIVFHFKYPFEAHHVTAIRTTDERVTYLLDCHLGPYGSWDYSYSPDFECRLSTEKPDTITYRYSDEFPAIPYDNLLSTPLKQFGPRETRGIFLWGELQPNCAKYPEYGRIRHFRLRGMELTLEVKNVKFGPRLKDDPLLTYRKDAIIKLDLEVTAKQDTSALLPTAESTKYLAPPLARPWNGKEPYDDTRNCSKVLERTGKATADEQTIAIELDFIPSGIKPGDKPITLNEDLLKKLLPELRSPRLMAFEDLGSADERAGFLEGGYSFVLRGDFDRNGFPDIVLVGKYDNPQESEKNSFIAVLGIRGKKVIREFVSKIKRDHISLIRVINYKPNIDAIGLSYNLASDDCGYLYWTGKKWQYDECRSVF
jgi:hypothetical protein